MMMWVLWVMCDYGMNIVILHLLTNPFEGYDWRNGFWLS